ncbi:MAG: 50S ribosomal protein L5 [Parcubacteria group bacterium]|nr:50S ribosomal protein L5 [Parcubacteria group bacterium]
MISTKQNEKTAFKALQARFGYTNAMEAPRLVKIAVSAGTGSAKDKKQRNEVVASRLAKITGQKPALRGAKKSIATFKLREGDPVGYMVTMRGARMYAFLDKLFNIAVPRMRDFRGFVKTGIDAVGNLTLGIKEHVIFPETSDEDLKDVFGLAITIVTTAKKKEEATAFLEHLGVPFKK